MLWWIKKISLFLIKLLISTIPSLLILVGSFLIALGSTQFLSNLWGFQFPFKFVAGYYVYVGLSIIIISLISSYFISKKISPSSGWIISLLTHAISITLLLTLLLSPLFHFFLMSSLFRFGFCDLINKTTENFSYPSLEQKDEELTIINQFCTSAGKIFKFKYP